MFCINLASSAKESIPQSDGSQLVDGMSVTNIYETVLSQVEVHSQSTEWIVVSILIILILILGGILCYIRITHYCTNRSGSVNGQFINHKGNVSVINKEMEQLLKILKDPKLDPEFDKKGNN